VRQIGDLAGLGSDDAWDYAEEVMLKVLKRIEAESGGKIRTSINPGEGAFYGPKFEYGLRDAIGRDWQCGSTRIAPLLRQHLDVMVGAGLDVESRLVDLAVVLGDRRVIAGRQHDRREGAHL
jgi:hypothetical protein